jgi:hypothetical protein
MNKSGAQSSYNKSTAKIEHYLITDWNFLFTFMPQSGIQCKSYQILTPSYQNTFISQASHKHTFISQVHLHLTSTLQSTFVEATQSTLNSRQMIYWHHILKKGFPKKQYMPLAYSKQLITFDDALNDCNSCPFMQSTRQETAYIQLCPLLIRSAPCLRTRAHAAASSSSHDPYHHHLPPPSLSCPSPSPFPLGVPLPPSCSGTQSSACLSSNSACTSHPIINFCSLRQRNPNTSPSTYPWQISTVARKGPATPPSTCQN